MSARRRFACRRFISVSRSRRVGLRDLWLIQRLHQIPNLFGAHGNTHERTNFKDGTAEHGTEAMFYRHWTSRGSGNGSERHRRAQRTANARRSGLIGVEPRVTERPDSLRNYATGGALEVRGAIASKEGRRRRSVRAGSTETIAPNHVGSGTRMAQNEPDATGAIAVANSTTMHTRATNPRSRSTASSLPRDYTFEASHRARVSDANASWLRATRSAG
jgi:hypothetical protein